MSLAEVKNLLDGAKPLTDIPAMLREFAEMIERGDYPGTNEVLLIRNVPGTYPAIHGYGQTSPHSSLTLLTAAQFSLIHMFHNGKGPVSR